MQRLERYAPDVLTGWMGSSPTGPWADISQAAELLRPIRLYHWLKVLQYSNLLEEAERAGAKDVIKRVRACYTLHMGHVQQLNEFFDVGDTAEGDNK